MLLPARIGNSIDQTLRIVQWVLRMFGLSVSVIKIQRNFFFQLQMQMEQMQLLYQGMLEKQQVANFTPPQPWIPQPNLGESLSLSNCTTRAKLID